MAAYPGSTLPPGLQLKFITSPTDAARLASVKFAAFRNNELNTLMYPVSSNERGTIAWLEERERQELSKNKSTVVAIINTANGDEVIACAKWKIPPRLLHGVTPTTTTSVGHQPQQTSGEGSRTLKDDLPPYPHDANVALQTQFREILSEHRTKYSDPNNDYILGSLYTHPKYQGCGCASAILQWGIQQANTVGAKIYLESSPQAHGLYAKYGWRDVDQSVIDLSQYGGKGLYSLAIMIREPTADSG